MISKRTLGLTVIVAALTVIFSVDLVCWEGRRDITKQLANSESVSAFRAEMTISDLTYKERTRSAAASSILLVRPTDGKLEIKSVNYSYQIGPKGSRELTYCDELMSSCFTAGFESDSPNGLFIPIAIIRNEAVSIVLNEDKSEIWYPFDEYSFQFDILGYVNRDNQRKLGDPNLYLGSLTIKDSEPNYVLREREGRMVLVRKPFVRIVTVVFFILSMIFGFYLIKLRDPAELLPQALGLFGALWGLRALLLPNSVTVFPTLIDYAILTEFCFLFVAIIYRVTTRTQSGAQP